jgi:hypothetical protein
MLLRSVYANAQRRLVTTRSSQLSLQCNESVQRDGCDGGGVVDVDDDADVVARVTIDFEHQSSNCVGRCTAVGGCGGGGGVVLSSHCVRRFATSVR